VIIADRDAHGEAAAASLRESGAQALFISCNIGEKAQVEALFSQAEEAFGPVDIVVNNAGINRDAMLHKLSEADWDTVIDVNLKGTFSVCSRPPSACASAARAALSISLPPAGLATSGKPTIRRQKPAWWDDQNRLPRTGEERRHG
jgi:NAD(P)-dependent dehydrogenase (short-subunit alcohol dehydrogenase family)